MERLRESWGAPRVALAGFVLRFLFFLWVFSTAVLRIPDAVHLKLQEGTAILEYGLMSLFTDRVTRHSNVLIYDGFGVEIVAECFGLLEMAIYSAAVLAFATTWRKRAIGIGVGVPIIFFFNFTRILMLVIVGRYSRALFDFAHLYFWQATLIVVITALWLLWVRYVVRDETGPVVHA
ncbi:MAG: archaeosortase/exosortase family protein [Myxococcota bacterium]